LAQGAGSSRTRGHVLRSWVQHDLRLAVFGVSGQLRAKHAMEADEALEADEVFDVYTEKDLRPGSLGAATALLQRPAEEGSGGGRSMRGSDTSTRRKGVALHQMDASKLTQKLVDSPSFRPESFRAAEALTYAEKEASKDVRNVGSPVGRVVHAQEHEVSPALEEKSGCCATCSIS